MKHTALFILLFSAMPTTAATIDCASVPGLAVDADGAPGSYRVDCKGLSFTCDGVFAVANGVAHTQKNDPQHWQTLCTQHWNEAQRTGDFSQVKIVGFLAADGRPVLPKAAASPAQTTRAEKARYLEERFAAPLGADR